MTGELVSAVIPTYNYGHFVCEAIDSALAQTYQPVEVIVVDDGSTDDTRERLVSYMDRIRYIHQVNQGLSAARNTGICAAHGKLIALLDSDDAWHPRRIEFQMRYLSANPQTALVGAENVTNIANGWPEIGDEPKAVAFSAAEIMVRSRFGPSGVLVRRECFDAVGDFDTSLRSAEDRDMWIRIASRYPVVKLANPLWRYRLHSGNMSAAAVRMEENEMKVLRRALEAENAPGWLRRKVISYTLKSAAYRYAASGDRMKAIGRVLRSLALWPFPFASDERITPFERPKMLTLFFLRMLRSRFAPSLMR
ncbi:MAG: glycosyltransferase family 2 protein [Planctomycetia bacterium]|nr:glycosyltransferase family 2 protein [Planctomycetia bacterium]